MFDIFSRMIHHHLFLFSYQNNFCRINPNVLNDVIFLFNLNFFDKIEFLSCLISGARLALELVV